MAAYMIRLKRADFDADNVGLLAESGNLTEAEFLARFLPVVNPSAA
jgi:hypothetical protein